MHHPQTSSPWNRVRVDTHVYVHSTFIAARGTCMHVYLLPSAGTPTVNCTTGTQFSLTSDPDAEVPEFTLSCTSMGLSGGSAAQALVVTLLG